MKKLILLYLCVLLASSAIVFGAYTVSGQVKDESGNPVNGATVYINCYPSSGPAYPTVTTNSGQVAGVMGWYSGGWADKNCNGEKIVVKAVSGNKSGTLSWTAGGVADANKDVTIKASAGGPYMELHCEADPIAMNEAAISSISTVNLYVQMAYVGPPILVNGGTATLVYDTTRMTCTGVAPSTNPSSPFMITYSNVDPANGIITVEAHEPGGAFIPIMNGEMPTSFFDVFFEAADVSKPTLSTVQVSSEMDAQVGMGYMQISTFPGVTQNLIGTPHTSSGWLLIDSEEEWQESLDSGHVHPMQEIEWMDYMHQWDSYRAEGDPYPTNTFEPAGLYVYGGGGGGGLDPEDAGLVMGWGEPSLPDGDYSSAWKYDYLLDPDLSNSTIKVTITPPQFGGGGQINAVSFGIRDINGNVRSWWWSCPAPIQWNVPTAVTIDTSKVGINATNPVASGFVNNPMFDITKSQVFIVDENFQWIFNPMPVPPPGNPVFGVMWNYWHNLIVTPNLPGGGANSKNFIKWSQPPEEIEPRLINGWDEHSLYWQHPIMADDWECSDERPITDIHWWGSFIGWTQPKLPPVLPTAFHIGIWTDVPNGADPQYPFSHPGTLVWENMCTSWVWNFAGFDKDPQGRPERENEACFQFNQLLPQDKWFYQKPDGPDGKRVYWLSIAAIYPQGQQILFPFGWKTRPHFFNDDAVRTGMVIDPTGMNIWPPVIGSQWASGMPIQIPEYPEPGQSWDLAFELTTCEPGYADNPIPGDIAGPLGPEPDGTVNLFDFSLMASHWLETAP